MLCLLTYATTDRHFGDVLSDVVLESIHGAVQQHAVLAMILEAWFVLAAKVMPDLSQPSSASLYFQSRFSIVSACEMVLQGA